MAIDFFLVFPDGAKVRMDAQRAYVIGRGEEADIQLHDAMASRRHARLVFEMGTFWWIEDMGSRNGLTVNGRILRKRQQLIDGAQIQIGGVTICYLMLPRGADPGVLARTAERVHCATTIRPSSELGDIEQLGATFTGVFDGDSLLDLLQTMCLMRKSGRLDLFQAGMGMSWVWFTEGAIVDAATGRQTGLDALETLARSGHGRFAFFADAVMEHQPSIDAASGNVLIELARRLDERR